VILAIALSPSVDVTYVVEELVEGGQARPLEVHRVAGGKAINAARAAAALGAAVRVVAPLGGGTGTELADGLAAAGIPLRRVPTALATRSCVSVFSRASGSLTEVYEHAPALDDAWAGIVAAVSADLGTAPLPGWAVLSGSIPATGTDDPIGELAEIVARAGARLAIDTHGAALDRALDLGPELAPALVKVNRAEAAAALGSDGPAAELAARLHDRTGRTAVVSDGPSGIAAADDTGRWLAVVPDVRGGFPVGSGDSLLGALVADLDAGSPLDQAIGRAAAVATANALVPGAAVFRREDVAALLPRVVTTPA
jgi:1-phosphofructokinase family hexose kinase